MSLEKYRPRILKRFPNYRFSWEILTEIILENVAGKPVWLDIGAGPNYLIAEQPGAELGVGLDSEKPEVIHHNQGDCYCLGLAERLPFKDDSFDFITSRYTFEHLAEPKLAISEIGRAIKPGGIVIIQTTNFRSPLIKLSNLIPFGIKKRLFRAVFRDVPSGTFKTYYRINRPEAFKEQFGPLRLQKLIMVGDILCHNYFLYLITMGLNRILDFFKLTGFKDNIIVIYRKDG